MVDNFSISLGNRGRIREENAQKLCKIVKNPFRSRWVPSLSRLFGEIRSLSPLLTTKSMLIELVPSTGSPIAKHFAPNATGKVGDATTTVRSQGSHGADAVAI